MISQPPLTFHSRSRPQRGTAVGRYRPDDITAQAPPEMKTFAEYLRIVFRQVFDLIYQLQDLFTPAGLFVSGDITDDPIEVPPEAAPEDLGTSLGMDLTLTRAGRWLVSASVCLEIIGDTDLFTLSLTAGQSPLGYFGLYEPAADGTIQLHQQWLVISVTGDESLVLRIKKAAGAGTSAVNLGNSTFSAVWEGA